MQVESLLTHYEWIATDRQYFGQPNTAYDFEANDPKEATRRTEKLQQQKVSCTVEPPNKGHFGANSFVPCREAVPISEVK